MEFQFKQPFPYTETSIAEIASAWLQQFGREPLNRTSTDIVFDLDDRLFNYSMFISFFRGLATLRLTSRSLTFNFEGAQTQNDFDVVRKLALDSVSTIPIELLQTFIGANAEFAFDNGESLDAWFDSQIPKRPSQLTGILLR